MNISDAHETFSNKKLIEQMREGKRVRDYCVEKAFRGIERNGSSVVAGKQKSMERALTEFHVMLPVKCGTAFF